MNSNPKIIASRLLLILFFMLCFGINCINAGLIVNPGARKVQSNSNMICVPVDDTVRARRNSCLLRPDTGPCRADIIMWYYDAKQRKCFRFFWGGCQGNGNRFDSKVECTESCFLNTTMPQTHRPYFCSLPFDFGTCFGQYNRWGWDKFTGGCRRHLYSGCGGNQNNFETRELCLATCGPRPNEESTTCLPYAS